MSEASISATTRSAAPQRPLAWPLLVASGLAILLVGIAFTGLVLANIDLEPRRIPAAFWTWVLGAGLLTIASLGLRSLRWVFLLRRSEIRIPIADSFIGYLAGLSLLFVPFLLGEMAVRAAVHRSRAGVPIATTCVLNIWERSLDLVALAAIVLAASGHGAGWRLALLCLVIASLSRSVRELFLTMVVAVVNLAVTRTVRAPRIDRSGVQPLTTHRAWLAALATSVAAWMLPAIALWGLSQAWGYPFTILQGHYAYAASALTGGLLLAPGGVLIVGENILSYLRERAGFSAADAALTVLSVRMATAGLATAIGILFVRVHVRLAPSPTASHFDDIAHAYGAQLPEARRLDLLARKTQLMQRVLAGHGGGARGLDVGCGPGWYVARVRQMCFDVHGIDDSAGQVETARRTADDPSTVRRGSMLEIPAADASYDFVYCINVLHHLDSMAQQRDAFVELVRVLRPGGLLFVHEINTTNPLFRFYMGYIFPLLNCIDEGVERWLLPHRLSAYTPAPVIEIHYFTFLPDFLPGPIVRLLRPLERLLEASPIRAWSAHYMAVVQKPRPGAPK